MRYASSLALCAVLAMSAAHAADDNNRFSIRGAGLLTCKALVEEHEKKSPAYAMIGGWLDGYITGVNQHARETYDIAPFESTELLMIVMLRHCATNGDDLVYSVANSILGRLHDQRLQQSSPFQTIRVGNAQTRLYEDVVRRVQERLRQTNHFDGDATGIWNDATSAAVAAYQASVQLEATGYPDQSTLWRLLGDSTSPQ